MSKLQQHVRSNNLPGLPGHPADVPGRWCHATTTATDVGPIREGVTSRCNRCGAELIWAMNLRTLDVGAPVFLVAWPLAWSGQQRAKWWLSWESARTRGATSAKRRGVCGPRSRRWRAHRSKVTALDLIAAALAGEP